MTLIEIAGKRFTRFKISKKDWKQGFMREFFKDKTPVKENSRFIYFELEGDFLNGKKG